ncbi:hypothetical protein [Paenibacillus sp. NPDC057934]
MREVMVTERLTLRQLELLDAEARGDVTRSVSLTSDPTIKVALK